MMATESTTPGYSVCKGAYSLSRLFKNNSVGDRILLVLTVLLVAMFGLVMFLHPES